MQRLVYIIALWVPLISAQCESLGVSGPHSQIIMTLPTSVASPDFWQTTASDGVVLSDDSNFNNIHFVFNNSLYDTIVTCLYTEGVACCASYYHEEGNTSYDGWLLVTPATCDTVYINTVQYLTDTVVEYIELIILDTVIEYIELATTDTLVEFASINTYIDCTTGEPCDQQYLNDPPACTETSIYVPSTVVLGSVWYVTADDGCWHKWELNIYNILGNLVWTSYSMYDEWNANVTAGTYVYTISANSYTSSNTFEFSGTVTVL